MLNQTEGSRAVAETVAHCRPEVIGAYPVSPQTHMVEELGRLVKSGALKQPCDYINVESERDGRPGRLHRGALSGARRADAGASIEEFLGDEAIKQGRTVPGPSVTSGSGSPSSAPVRPGCRPRTIRGCSATR